MIGFNFLYFFHLRLNITHFDHHISCLGDELVGDGGEELGLVVLGRDGVGADGLLGVALALGRGLLGLLGLGLQLLVLLDAGQEVLSGKVKERGMDERNDLLNRVI